MGKVVVTFPYVVVVPARFASTRFPGKPLADLGGKSVLMRACERCFEIIDRNSLIVATDDERIARHCGDHDVVAVMTSPDHPTGTDRVAEVAGLVDADWYVNVQGDEPFLEPEALRAIIEACEIAPPSEMVINASCDIASEDEFRDATVPKVARTSDGRLLYISRAAIPTTKALSYAGCARRQVGLYGFRKSALLAFSGHGGKTQLEALEDIEILRFLELGYAVTMIDVPAGGNAIDTPDDLVAANEFLKRI